MRTDLDLLTSAVLDGFGRSPYPTLSSLRDGPDVRPAVAVSTSASALIAGGVAYWCAALGLSIGARTTRVAGQRGDAPTLGTLVCEAAATQYLPSRQPNETLDLMLDFSDRSRTLASKVVDPGIARQQVRLVELLVSSCATLRRPFRDRALPLGRRQEIERCRRRAQLNRRERVDRNNRRCDYSNRLCEVKHYG
jgi:hypothetical protein